MQGFMQGLETVSIIVSQININNFRNVPAYLKCNTASTDSDSIARRDPLQFFNIKIFKISGLYPQKNGENLFPPFHVQCREKLVYLMH